MSPAEDILTVEVGEMELGVTEERWKAIITNDASYDDQFFYAVKTTGIFCRPSCKSKPPRWGNVRIFQQASEAIREEFRPCKRCKPTGQRLPDREWVAQITNYIDAHYSEKLTLAHLADMCHGSPYHLHRTFKRIKEMTPVEYIQQKRIDKAKELLAHSGKPIAAISAEVGVPNTPYFITLFKKTTGQTPSEYRQNQLHGNQ